MGFAAAERTGSGFKVDGVLVGVGTEKEKEKD
jgi:hypothetical protein